MKILMISPRYYAGGAERSARELALGLRKRGHSVDMWTAIKEHATPAWVTSSRKLIERFLYPINLLCAVGDWRHVSTYRAINRLSKVQYDIVHLHNLHGYWVSIKAISELCQRMPVVWTLHDEWAPNGGVPYDLSKVATLGQIVKLKKKSHRLNALSTREKRACIWRNYLTRHPIKPRRLICPSAYLASICAESQFTKEIPITRLPYGCSFLQKTMDDRRPKEICKKNFGISNDHTTFLIIASNLNSPYKGISYAVKALNNLHLTSKTNLSVLIMGSNAKAIAEQINSDKIHLVSGYAQNDEELIAAYRAADATIIPSIADNFPYAVLESFSCGTPVISFKVGGLTEMVRNNGLLAKEISSDHLTVELETALLDKKKLKSLGDSALAWVNKHCNFENYLDSTEQIYQQEVTQA